MAYSFTDVYRPLRFAMRLNGVLVGIGFGLSMLFLPARLLDVWGVVFTGPTWPAHIAGACLIGLGVSNILSANDRMIGLTSLVSLVVANTLLAFVLLIAYLQGQLADLTSIGQVLLVILFVLCLVCAVLPLRYFRVDTQL